MKAIKSALLALGIAQLVDGALFRQGDDLLRTPQALREREQPTQQEKKNPCDQIQCGWFLCPDGAFPETRPGDCCPSCPDNMYDECQPNPCVHGTCTDGVNSYTCQCSPGYRGDNCDEGKKRRL